MNVKMATSILCRAMDAKVVIAIRLAVSTHLVNDLPVNVIANQALLGMICGLFSISLRFESFTYLFVFIDYDAINARRINTVSRWKDASHAIVTKAVQRDFNVTNTASVRVMIMSKAVVAIVAKRTNTIVIRAVWIVPTATI